MIFPCPLQYEKPLGFQFQAQTQFVASGVDALPVNQAGQGEFDTCTQTHTHTQQGQDSHQLFWLNCCAWKSLTWSESLSVTNTNKAIVVHFSLERARRTVGQVFLSLLQPFPFICFSTYTDGSVFVQLVFGSDAEASAVAASGPRQAHRRFQLVAHLLVNRAPKLRSIIAGKTRTSEDFMIPIGNRHWRVF